jgi:hypothetical protein
MRMFRAGWVLGVLVMAAAPAQGATIIFDDFEGGTTMGWTVALGLGGGGASGPTVVSGGQGGALDDYLLLTSSGVNGPGGRLTMLNDTQWAGDYVDAGIMTITMDVRNFGTTDLALRLAFYDFSGAIPEIAYSDDPITLPTGGGWTQISFDISASALLLSGAATADDVLRSVSWLRLYHSPSDDVPAPLGIPPITGLLGVDNIGAEALPTQVTAPEPAMVLLLATGAAGALVRRRAAARSHTARGK